MAEGANLCIQRHLLYAHRASFEQPPLTSPLLVLNRSLHKDAVKIFKVIQRIMGDRDRDRPVGVRVQTDTPPLASPGNMGNNTQSSGTSQSVLEEERWLLVEGVLHGELRDEIYCQTMKQLSSNPSTYASIYL